MTQADIGKLFVFEGPDGSGKTTFSRALVDRLNANGVRSEWLSFPGADAGTLGKHVYKIHHNPRSVGIKRLGPTSVQLLHIAAHVDLIESRILPALKQGQWVVLDRFWWSTLVYGAVTGVNRGALDTMIEVERMHWGRILPSHVFLLQRKAPHGQDLTLERVALEKEYADLALKETAKYPITTIGCDGSKGEVLERILRYVHSAKQCAPKAKPTTSEVNGNARMGSRAAVPKSTLVFTKLTPAKTTVVYDTYWRFAAERQAIFFRRLTGSAPPWTDDRILREYKFTNAYRASDRTSQYLISKVIYSGSQTAEEILFRTLIFKLFNRIETWELLDRAFGQVSYGNYSFARYDAVLSKAIDGGDTIYSGAYIMPSGGRSTRKERKHRMHLRLVERMLRDELFLRLGDAASMGKAFELLRAYPTIGDFLAYQYVTDLNYSSIINFSEMEFTVPGPGARDGIRKCFSDLGGLNETDLIKLVAERQQIEFEARGEEFKSLWGRPLQLIDCQNLFCEVDKYSRVKHPEFAGRTGRLRIKQRYRMTKETIQYWYPPKWGLNDKVAQGGKCVPTI